MNRDSRGDIPARSRRTGERHRRQAFDGGITCRTPGRADTPSAMASNNSLSHLHWRGYARLHPAAPAHHRHVGFSPPQRPLIGQKSCLDT